MAPFASDKGIFRNIILLCEMQGVRTPQDSSPNLEMTLSSSQFEQINQDT